MYIYILFWFLNWYAEDSLSFLLKLGQKNTCSFLIHIQLFEAISALIVSTQDLVFQFAALVFFLFFLGSVIERNSVAFQLGVHIFWFSACL